MQTIDVKSISVPILMFLCLSGHTQQAIHTGAAPLIAMAQFSGMSLNPFVPACNPAIIPRSKGLSGAAYAENRFMIPGLNRLALSAVLTRGRQAGSLYFEHFGTTNYSEACFGLAYGRSLGMASLSVLFRYQAILVPALTTRHFIVAGIASAWRISEKATASVRFMNPQGYVMKPSMNLSPLPSAHMGIGLQASPLLYVGFESLKEAGKPLQVVATVHYLFDDHFYSRACWSTAGDQPYGGWGFVKSAVTLEAGCSFHPVLGFSPSLLVIFQQKPQTHED